MRRGSKLTDEERMQAVQEYFDGKGSHKTIANAFRQKWGNIFIISVMYSVLTTVFIIFKVFA